MRFHYDAKDKRVQATVGFIKLDPKLQYALGFAEPTMRKGVHKAAYPPDVQVGIRNMWIYTPLIEYQMVGPVMTPLIKIVPIRGSFGDQSIAEFTNPHYVDVLEKNFDSVEISIKDMSGNPMPFSFGGVVVKLHFRKKRFM